MTRWIIRDYFGAFRWEKVKAALRGGRWWYLFHFAIFLPIISGFLEKKEYFLTYQLISLPIIFAFFSAALHPMGLSKIMFLCPMEKRVRREYVVRSCQFRIAFVIFLGVIGVTLLSVGGRCDGVAAGVVLCNEVVMALLLSGFRETKPVTETGKNGMDREIASRGAVEVADVTVTAISSYGIACMLCWDTPVADWVKWIFVGAAVLIQLPLTVKFMTGWKTAVDRAVSYEGSYL